jgi:hypothetical protein
LAYATPKAAFIELHHDKFHSNSAKTLLHLFGILSIRTLAWQDFARGQAYGKNPLRLKGSVNCTVKRSDIHCRASILLFPNFYQEYLAGELYFRLAEWIPRVSNSTSTSVVQMLLLLVGFLQFSPRHQFHSLMHTFIALTFPASVSEEPPNAMQW